MILGRQVMVAAWAGGCLFAAIASYSPAQVIWDGSGADSNWTTGGNWDTGSAPGSGDEAVFDADNANSKYSVNLGGTRTVNEVTFQAATSANGFTIGTNQFRIGAGGITNADDQTQTFNIIRTEAVQTWDLTGGLSIGTNINMRHNLTINGAGNIDLLDRFSINANLTLTLNNTGGVTTNNLLLKNVLTLAGSADLDVSGSINNSGGNRSFINNSTGDVTVNNISLSENSTNRTLTIGGSSDTLVSGIISDGSSTASNLTKTGSGNLTLEGANTYDGTTTVSAGTLTIAHNTALGTTTGSTTIASGAELSLTNGISVAENITNNGTVANTSDSNTLSGVVSGTGAVDVDAGTLILTGANTYSGGTTVAGSSTLQIGSGGTTGSLTGNIANSGTVDFNRSNTYSFGGVISGSGGVDQTGTGTTTLTSAQTYTGNTDITAGTLQLSGSGRLADTTAVTITSPGIFDLNNVSDTVGSIAGSGDITLGSGTLTAGGDNTDTTFSGVISETGGLTKAGTGTLTLSGANIYTGGTTVSAGTLQIGDSGTTGSVTGNITNNATLTFDRSDDTTYTDTISGTGNLIKNGAGTMTLDGANTFTGTTTVNAGTLAVQGGGSNRLAPNAQVTINNTGTFEIRNSNSLDTGDADAADFTVNSGGTLSIVSGGSTGGNSHVHLGDLNLDGGTVDLSYTGTDLAFDGESAILRGAIHATDDSTIQFGTGATTANAGIGLNNSTSITVDSGVTLTVSAELEDGGPPGSDGFEKLGTGTLTLSGDNSYTAATTITAGTVIAQNNTALGTDAAGTTVATGATLQLENNITIASEALTVTGTGSLTNSADSNTYGGVISGTGVVNVTAGELTLSNDNTYSGGTTVTAGTLQIGAGGTTGSIVGDISNNGAVVFDRSDNLTFSNVISGTGSFEQAGSGTTTLTGTNTYTGVTTISAGTLQLGNNGTTGSVAGNITNNSALIFNRSDDLTYANVLSGSGTVEQAGTGNLTLSGANTYTGATTVSDGTLTLAHANALGTAAAGTTVDSGATLALTNGITVASEAVTNNGTVTNTSGTNTFGGVISGTGVVTTASGNLTLSNTNTYSGDTTVGNGSTLTLSADNALGTGSTTVDSGGTLALTGDITAAQTNFDLSGMGNSTAGAIQNVSGDNRLTGDFSLSAATTTQSDAGTLILGVDPPSEDFATDTFDLGANALTIDGDGDTELNAGLSGSGNLVKDGTGTLTVVGVVDKTGTTAFTGEVTVNDGTLVQATLFNVAPGTVGYDDYGINNDITVGNGDATAATLTLGTNDAGSGTNFAHMIAGGVDLTVNSDGTFNTRGHATVLEDVTLDNGTINANKLAGGNEDALVIKGSISATNTSGDSTINGVIDFNQPGNPPASLTTVDVASGGTLDINARVQNGGISKTGDGTLELSGVNTYSGATNVTAGIVRVDQGTVGSNSGLGNEDGGTVVSSGAQLQLDDVTISGEALTLNGTGISGDGALQTVASTTNTWGGTVAIASTSEIEVSSDSSLTLSGVMSGSGQTLTIDGPGTSEISGEITSLSILNKTGSGQLTLSGDSKTIATTNVSEGTLTLGTSDILSDALDLNLSGTGTFTMGGGITETIDQLTVAGSSVLDVHDVLTLNGGTISGGDGSGSTGSMILTAGNTLNITNDFDFGGTLELTAGTTLALSGGHTFDLGTLNVTGNTVIDFTGADANTLNLGTLNISPGVTIDVIGWESYFDLWTAANFIGASLDNRNGVSAQITFNGFSPADTIWLTEDFGDFEITVPEPGTYGAVLMGMSLATWLLRRPRRANLPSNQSV